MENYNVCPNCMRDIEPGTAECPYCQFKVGDYRHSANHLPLFTVLQGKYMVGRVLGHGGFGITYIGWDINLQTYIAIKEYYPDSIVKRDTTQGITTPEITSEDNEDAYRKGLDRYLEEARNLSKFYQLSGIVSVKDFFYENNTGYIVMEYLDGINLKQYLDNSGGRLDEATVLRLMKPVFESMYQIHKSGLVHRDISPDNIMVNSQGQIKLIDFGSARGQSAIVPEATYTVVLKHGYAPPEQYYAKGNQGPWTDIYSLCATMYKMLTGVIPPNSIERMDNDTYMPAASYGIQISEKTEYVLRKGLAVKLQDRYQNIGELLTDLYSDGTAMAAAGQAVPDFVKTPQSPGQGSSYGQSGQTGLKSMHLSDAKPGNKKAFIGIAIAAAAILLIIIGILVFGGGGGDKEDTTEPATNDTQQQTEEPDTDEPSSDTEEPGSTEDVSEEPPVSAGYVFPTEISDDWHDYNIKIKDTIYSFPLPYSSWKECGWTASMAPEEVASGNIDYVYCEDDRGYEVTIYVVNFSTSSQPLMDCYVVGVGFDSYNDYTGLDVEMAGGIKLYESTGDEVKAALGAPDYIYEGDDYTDYAYAGDDYEDGVDISLDASGIVNEIRMINTATPEGLEVSAADISQEVPEINSLYTAPAEMGTNLTDCTFMLDEKLYQLPCPVSELVADGWAVDTSAPDYIAGNSSEYYVKMQKNGSSIEVDIRNYTSDAILPVNGYVTSINVESAYCSLYFGISGDIVLGQSTISDMTTAYDNSGIEGSVDEYNSFTALSGHTSDYDKSFYAYTDPETGIIDELSMDYGPDTIR